MLAAVAFTVGCCHDTCDSCRDGCGACGHGASVRNCASAGHLTPVTSQPVAVEQLKAVPAEKMPAPPAK
jgi:hypothetical protein